MIDGGMIHNSDLSFSEIKIRISIMPPQIIYFMKFVVGGATIRIEVVDEDSNPYTVCI